MPGRGFPLESESVPFMLTAALTAVDEASVVIVNCVGISDDVGFGVGVVIGFVDGVAVGAAVPFGVGEGVELGVKTADIEVEPVTF